MGGCPFHSGDGSESTAEADEPDPDRAGGSRAGPLDRREFVKSALLIGGVGALHTLAGCSGGLAPRTRAGERRIGAAPRLNRQHAWDSFESVVGTKNTAQPAASVFLMLDYRGDGEPAPEHRRQVETALRGIERHFEWNAEGVLFTMSYSASYFDRFEADPPPGAAPAPADEVVERASEITPYDPAPDSYDAFLLLTSENPANVLAAEEALWGNGDLAFEATFEGVFDKPRQWPDRRVGFAGPQFQERETEYEREYLPADAEVPDEAPLSMGFVAGFDASIPAEEAATLKPGQRFPGPETDAADVPTDLPYVGEVGPRDPGMFAEGTLKHLSYLVLHLDREDGDGWYDIDADRRRSQIYSPFHSESDTNAEGGDKPGSGLLDDPAGSPGLADMPAREPGSEDYADRTPDTAAEGSALTDGAPTTGHSQKSARARYDLDGDGELEQPCLRRDWDGIRPPENGYTERAGYHFNVPMRFNESIFTLLDANYSVGFRSLDGRIDHEETGGPASMVDGDSSGERNGLVPFMEATRRNNWLVPPITLRALPHPRPDELTVEAVERDGDRFRVTVSGLGDGEALDPGTVRFGQYDNVNKARGGSVADLSRDGDRAVLRVPVEDTAVTAETERVKLFGKRERTRKPVVGTYEPDPDELF